MSRVGVVCGALVMAFLAASSDATAQTTQPTLTADVGFAGVFKPDSWTPIYVTLADTSSRSGTIEVRTARGRIGNRVSARVQGNAKPTTFTLYAPLDPLDHVNVQWRDESGKLVSNRDLSERARENPAALGGPVFGVSGAIASANRVAGQIVRDTGEYVAAGAIPSRLLPERSIGYQSLDVLLLPELDTDAIDDAVEGQIIDWMRAGGMVITWPGAQVPADGSPLAAILPAKMGDIVVRNIDGKEFAVRSLRPADELAKDQSNDNTILFSRKVGLGQIAVFGFDPTMVYGSIDRRIAAFRQATGGQISMSPNDRRVGSFDPLVYQARGEEQLPTAIVSHDTGLWVGLAFGLVMGPGEALLLLMCRRVIFTPLTMTGFAIVVGAGLALSLKSAETIDRSIEVVVEDDMGIVVRSAIHAGATSAAPASWLIGRSADPLHETSGELSLLQRQDRLVPAGPVVTLSEHAPRVRSIEITSAKPLLLVDSAIGNAVTRVQSSDDTAWEKSVVLTQDELRPLAGLLSADQALTIANYLQPGSAADDPATVRRESAVEALASQPGWEPILMDRQIAQRIVRLFETESVAAIVAQRVRGTTTQFVIHIQRP